MILYNIPISNYYLLNLPNNNIFCGKYHHEEMNKKKYICLL